MLVTNGSSRSRCPNEVCSRFLGHRVRSLRGRSFARAIPTIRHAARCYLPVDIPSMPTLLRKPSAPSPAAASDSESRLRTPPRCSATRSRRKSPTPYSTSLTSSQRSRKPKYAECAAERSTIIFISSQHEKPERNGSILARAMICGFHLVESTNLNARQYTPST